MAPKIQFEITREFLIEYYVKRHKSMKACAILRGCCVTCIFDAIKREGIESRPVGGPIRFNITREWLIENYVNQNHSALKCAEMIGCNETLILTSLRKHNISVRPNRVLKVLISKEWLEDNYYNKELSMPQCSAILGCSIDCVYRAIKRYNLIPRNPGSQIGERNTQWRGGISPKPYCEKWNGKLRESIRDDFGRKCFLCHTTEEKSGRKLSVHHANFDKQSGCFGKRWNLVPLCASCHSKSNTNQFEYFNLLVNHWAYKYIEDGINI